MARPSHVQSGFTLIELSIVLAIIAVIAGGIMAGQSLLDAANIRAVVADVNKYRTAVESFQGKYSGLPGDLRNARDFFGASCGVDADACNGDGNGSINNTDESYRAWQHLELADMVEQSFTGLLGSGCTPDVNVPVSPMGAGAGFGFTNNASSYLTNRPSFVSLLVLGSNDSSYCIGAAVSVDNAYQIDLKTDDGNPVAGEAVGVGGSCVSGNDFDYSQSGAVCAVAFTLN